MKNKIIVYVFIILIAFSAFSTVVEASDLNSLTRAIKNNQNLNGILKGEGKETVYGLSRDFFDIARYVVISLIIIKVFLLFLEFRNAGEDIALRASIKTKVIWLILAILFTTNFWTIFNFISKTISKIKLL